MTTVGERVGTAELGAHVAACRDALGRLSGELVTVERWAAELAATLTGGGRLLVAGNGGSAALAQHLSAELVGRYRTDRRPFDALALPADTSALTALVNDYGPSAMYARQVHAYGRPGDVLLCLSTSGRSPNLLGAVAAAHEGGLSAWAMTGPAPNPLAGASDDVIVTDAAPPTVQEVQQVVVHLLCSAFDAAVG